MPRYFFHIRTEKRLFWDRTGFDLPDLWNAADAEMAAALWNEVMTKQLDMGHTVIVMDKGGKVLFVSAI